MMPGRELDALVAEKVMGLRYTPVGSHPNLHSEAWYIPAEESFIWNPPPYSTSIADAWLVVEKMHPDYAFQLQYVTHRYVAIFWCDAAHTYSASSDIPASAICLAALKAVGEEAS